ncbi:DoxX family protein [Salinibacillus xinjiangensis]|uniref:DoxX family membrane protein n=1 Tax=Salinibacillus xinjiangensis TaxID=1229268 RepID=A0A6G1X960_9BACI|nr:DoxX family protein [Salinibacillus xinjiangensis]MRG87469.1 DoxX family membrane protein [Salinibacillus xinjiangensis]
MYTSVPAMKLIRYIVAYVFITSGVMKLVNEELANYFMSLGLPYPILLLNLVAFCEVVGGVLILAQKWVKYATIPLIVIMVVAILLTKVPILHTGFLVFAFEARLDIVMLVLLIILNAKFPK